MREQSLDSFDANGSQWENAQLERWLSSFCRMSALRNYFLPAWNTSVRRKPASSFLYVCLLSAGLNGTALAQEANAPQAQSASIDGRSSSLPDYRETRRGHKEGRSLQDVPDSQSSGKRTTAAQNGPDFSALNLPILRTVKVLIPNLHVVAPGLLRGAQPSTECLRLLKESGVATVVNLRNEDVLVAQEADIVRGLGMNYVSIPLNVFERPSSQAIEKFLAVVTNSKNQPIYVHCQYGEDRTGAMCAIYRMRVEGWDVDRAYYEMLVNGFKPMLTQLSQAVFDFGIAKGDKPSQSVASSLAETLRKELGEN